LTGSFLRVVLFFEFEHANLSEFWARTTKEYKSTSDKALKCVLPFQRPVIVEREFSWYALIKNKYRNKLDAAQTTFKAQTTLIQM
jgi:hypothetical protein